MELEKNLKKTKGNYVFPKKLAKAMTTITPRTQYEASMLAMVFIILGLLFMFFYMPFTQAGLFMKIFAMFNGACGMVFLFSFLVTTYQQYVSYLSVMNLLEAKE